MKSLHIFKKLVVITVLGLILVACGGQQDQVNSNITAMFGSLRGYVGKATNITLRSNIPDNGNINIVLKDDKRRDIQTLIATNGQLETTIENLNVNEVYFVSVSGTNPESGYWVQVVPLFVLENGNFEIVASKENVVGNDPHVIKIQGGGEEQEFLETWNYAYGNEIVTFGEDGNFTERSITQEYIDQKKPLISTFYLITRMQNVKEKLNAYAQLYSEVPAHVQNSKYGVDIANHIHRISHAPSKIDFTKILTARTSRLLPFNVSDYADKNYLVLFIWATWEPTAVNQLEQVQEIVKQHSNAELLLFSLDSRMSDWKPFSDQRNLENSYMVRAETRQASIDLLYLTELPRILIVKPDGTVVEHEVEVTRLNEILGGLK